MWERLEERKHLLKQIVTFSSRISARRKARALTSVRIGRQLGASRRDATAVVASSHAGRSLIRACPRRICDVVVDDGPENGERYAAGTRRFAMHHSRARVRTEVAADARSPRRRAAHMRTNRIGGDQCRARHVALPRNELAAIEFELYAVDVEPGGDAMLTRRVSRRRAKLAHDICASEMNRYDRIRIHVATMRRFSSSVIKCYRNCMISEGLKYDSLHV